MRIDIWLDPTDVENFIKKALASKGYEAKNLKPQIDKDGNYTGFLIEADYNTKNSETYDRDR